MRLNIPGLVKGTGSWLMAAAMVLSACTTELASDSPMTGNGGQEELVTLKLLVPGAADAGKKGLTRTLNEGTETHIADLYILAFKPEDTGAETFQYFTKARTKGENQWETSLHVDPDDQTFVVIANADGTAGEKETSLSEKIISLKQGTGKDEVLKLLTVELTQNEKTSGFNAAADNNHRPFTMYGQKKATITGGTDIKLEVSLHRIMGRIQIYFGQNGVGLNDFIPEAVYLYKFNGKASVLPEGLKDTDESYVGSPTIPEGVSPIKGPVKYIIEQSANKLERSIYLFETQQPQGTDPSAHTERTCLVVKGQYQGKESSYYRVDLAKPSETDGTGLEYLDVLRNHSYNITVTSVSGQGHGTEEEAFQAKAANITANIVVWNDTEIGNVDFDGENFLGIGTMEYRVGKIKATHVQKVKASLGLEWSVELLEVDANGKVQQKAPDWINFEGEPNASGTGTGESANLAFNVETFSQSSGERQAVMRFTAGNLKIDALIIQDTSNPVFISVDEDILRNGIEYLEQGGFNEPLRINYGPKDVTLEWKILTAGGMEFSSTTIDGNVQTDPLAGETSPTTAEEGSYITWKGEAKQLNTEKGYETKTATLTLIAKNQTGDEIAAKTVKLYQKKYGVELDRNSITCSGKLAKIRVKGNMDWKVELIDDQDAVKDEWIEAFTQDQTGYASDEYTTTDDNVTMIQTEYQPVFNKETKKLTLKFTDLKDNNRTCIKTVDVRKGLRIDDVMYEVLGPINIKVIDAFNNKIADVSGHEKAKFADEENALLISGYFNGKCWVEGTTMKPANTGGPTGSSFVPILLFEHKFSTTDFESVEITWKYTIPEGGEIVEQTFDSGLMIRSKIIGSRLRGLISEDYKCSAITKDPRNEWCLAWTENDDVLIDEYFRIGYGGATREGRMACYDRLFDLDRVTVIEHNLGMINNIRNILNLPHCIASRGNENNTGTECEVWSYGTDDPNNEIQTYYINPIE